MFLFMFINDSWFHRKTFSTVSNLSEIEQEQMNSRNIIIITLTFHITQFITTIIENYT